jgi:Tfp pilus assembly protein PilN
MPRYDDLDPTMPTPKAAAAAPSGVDAMANRMEAMRRDLLVVRALCIALIAIALVLAGLVYQLSGRVNASERAIEALPATISQAADEKLAQLTPQLEKRLDRFEAMSTRIEQRIGTAENTVIERMRTEAPKVLDAYTQQKIAQIQREAARLQGNLPNLPKR